MSEVLHDLASGRVEPRIGARFPVVGRAEAFTGPTAAPVGSCS